MPKQILNFTLPYPDLFSPNFISHENDHQPLVTHAQNLEVLLNFFLSLSSCTQSISKSYCFNLKKKKIRFFLFLSRSSAIALEEAIPLATVALSRNILPALERMLLAPAEGDGLTFSEDMLVGERLMSFFC